LLHCINVKLVEVCDRIASGLSPRYYLTTDAIIWDYSGGDTFCRMCGGCEYASVVYFIIGVYEIRAKFEVIPLGAGAEIQNSAY